MIRVGIEWKVYANFSQEHPGSIIIQNNSGVDLFGYFGDIKPMNQSEDPSLVIPSGPQDRQYLFLTTPVWLSAPAEVVIRFTQMTLSPRLLNKVLLHGFLSSQLQEVKS